MKANIFKTRISGLGYMKAATANWQFVDIEQTIYSGTTVTFGDIYRSKDELLADLQRFASERGLKQ